MNLVGQGFKVVRRGKEIYMYRRELQDGKWRWVWAMTKVCKDRDEAEELVQKKLEDLWYKDWK